MSGVISRGVRAPIVREGDDIIKIVADSVVAAMAEDGFKLRERDVVSVTESVVARADGNYASVDDIAADVKAKLGGGTVGVVFPILSRNRFAICLRGIARGCKKVVLMLSYPSDEVGNHLFDEDTLDDSGVNPYTDVLSLEDYRRLFGYIKHPFTGVDYVEYYESVIREEGAEAEIVFANHAEAIVKYTENVICCDIHSRERSRRRIKAAGGKTVLTLCDILNAPVNGSGWCQYGLLGSNKATEGKVKLFPKNAQEVAEGIQAALLERTGVKVEAMVYGDGAFKDPMGKIWELADPVVSPGLHLRPRRSAERAEAEVSRRQRLCRALRQRAQSRDPGVHPQEGRRPQGQYGLRGHDAAPPDRSHRFSLRLDQRQRRQGHAHHRRAELLLQLR